LADSLFTKLKKRNVFKVGAAYLVLAWVVIQVTSEAVPALRLPEWVNSLVFYLGAIGFPFALFFAWAFEITPEGIKKESEILPEDSISADTGRKLNFVIIGLLVIALGYFIYESRFEKQPVDNTYIEDNTGDIAPGSEDESATDIVIEPEESSIAVLPFINRSSREEDQYFVDGIQDDLLTKLAKIHQMKVISRTSVMEYRDTTKKIPQIARELGVANILEGGVQRSGDHIRINAQLIHAATDEHLWAETYDKELNVNNVFSIQSEIAIAIAKAMKTKLTPEEKDHINKPLTDNLIAWDAYNKGLAGNSSTIESIEKSRRYLKNATELDHNFAVAFAQLAYTEMLMYWYNSNDTSLRNHAWQSIQSSRAIDDNTAELFVAEAGYYYWGFREFEKALQSANKAIAIAPNFPDALEIKGYILRRMGRFEESIMALDIAAGLKPRTTYALQENAETLVYMLRFEEAEKYIERINTIDPNNHDVSVIKGLLAIGKDGNLKLALKELARNKDGNSFTAREYWFALLLADQIDHAIEFAVSSKQLVNSGHSYASNTLMIGKSYYLKNDKVNTEKYLQLSIKNLEQELQTDSENENYLIGLCSAYAALGNAQKARHYCQSAIKYNKDAYGYPSDLNAVIEAYAMLGDNNEALKVMQRLLESKVRPSAHELKLNPFLNNLRGDPEFESLIERIASGELLEK